MLGFDRTYTTPFKEKIPASVDDFFGRVHLFKRFKRFFSRYLYAEIALRNSQRLEKITSQHQKILWVQWVDSYLGDSLMDLSSRVLLKEKKIDLLTKKNTANIYQNDLIFNQIFVNPNQCDKDYDLIIIGSYRQRELKILPKHILSIPHVSIYGYYNVDDFNRLYFSFFRVNQLLSYAFNEKFIYDNAYPMLPISNKDRRNVDSYNLPKDFLVIAVGGANIERTFDAWDEVVDGIIDRKLSKNIVLVGANNGKNVGEKILKAHSGCVIDKTSCCSFNETTEIIKRASILICCDGGLLHAANSVKTPVIALFYYINPAVRLIQANQSYYLMDLYDINNIQSKDIIKKLIFFQKNQLQ
jgi:heptosyltransferase-2